MRWNPFCAHSRSPRWRTMINWHRMFMTSTFHQQNSFAFFLMPSHLQSHIWLSINISARLNTQVREERQHKSLFTCCAFEEFFERLKNWFWFFIRLMDALRLCRTCKKRERKKRKKKFVVDCIFEQTIIYCCAIRGSCFVFIHRRFKFILRLPICVLVIYISSPESLNYD